MIKFKAPKDVTGVSWNGVFVKAKKGIVTVADEAGEALSHFIHRLERVSDDTPVPEDNESQEPVAQPGTPAQP